jgi:hypothetical protein
MRSMWACSSRTRAWRALHQARYSSGVHFFIVPLIVTPKDGEDLLRVRDNVGQRSHDRQYLAAVDPLVLVHVKRMRAAARGRKMAT